MLRSVAEVAELTGLSKVSIYNKIKLKEFMPYIVKSKGISYINEEGVSLIQESINLKEEALNSLNNDFKEENEESDVGLENSDNKEIKERLKDLNLKYITSLNEEILSLKQQLSEKDNQIKQLHRLLENSQVLLKNKQEQILLKNKQDKAEDEKLLEDHFNDLDNKLMEIKEKMEDRKKKARHSFFKRKKE